MDIQHMDLIELNDDGVFYQVELMEEFEIAGRNALDKPTLIFDYQCCDDDYYSYYYEVNGVLDEITAVYRKIDGELKLIYKKQGE